MGAFTAALAQVKYREWPMDQALIRELREKLRQLGARLPGHDHLLTVIMASGDGFMELTFEDNDTIRMRMVDLAGHPGGLTGGGGPQGKGVSADHFAALFAGDEPIDPDKFRADLDQFADPDLAAPYAGRTGWTTSEHPQIRAHRHQHRALAVANRPG